MDNYLLEELLNIDDKITESELGLLGQFLKELPEKALNLGIRVVLAILALLLGLQIIRVIRKIVERALARTDADKGVSQFLDDGVSTANDCSQFWSGCDQCHGNARLCRRGFCSGASGKSFQLCRRCSYLASEALCRGGLYH